MSARADLEIRIYLSGVPDDLLGLWAVGTPDHEQAREPNVGVRKNARPGSIPVNGVYVVSSEIGDNIAVHFNDRVRDSIGLKGITDNRTHPSKADHHDVVAKLGRRRGRYVGVATLAGPL